MHSSYQKVGVMAKAVLGTPTQVGKYAAILKRGRMEKRKGEKEAGTGGLGGYLVQDKETHPKTQRKFVKIT